MEVVDETEALQRFFEGEGPRAGGGGDPLALGTRSRSPRGLGPPTVLSSSWDPPTPRPERLLWAGALLCLLEVTTHLR